MKRAILLTMIKISRQFPKMLDCLAQDILRNFILKIFPFIIVLFFNSCIKSVEEISWELKKHPAMLVVDGAISNQLIKQGIRLTRSSTYFSSAEPAAVHNASVSVNDGNINYNFTESPDSSGWYYSDEPFKGISDKTYNLNIGLKEAINGQKEYTCSSTMPQGLNIDSIKCLIYALPKVLEAGTNNKVRDTTILLIFYFGQEPISPGNYYCAKIYRNYKPLFSSIKDYPFTDDRERNGADINMMSVVKNVAAFDTISFFLFSVNKMYYKYINAISNMDQTGDINSPQGPPANAEGNVNNALGFFIATYISSGYTLAFDMR